MKDKNKNIKGSKMKKVFGKLVLMGLMVIGVTGNAADFNTQTAKYKLIEKGCVPLAGGEVNQILNEVNVTHTRGYLRSLSFYDVNHEQNVLFMFSDGYSQMGLPNYLTTFTTMEGCIKFRDNPQVFAPYLR